MKRPTETIERAESRPRHAAAAMTMKVMRSTSIITITMRQDAAAVMIMRSTSIITITMRQDAAAVMIMRSMRSITITMRQDAAAAMIMEIMKCMSITMAEMPAPEKACLFWKIWAALTARQRWRKRFPVCPAWKRQF